MAVDSFILISGLIGLVFAAYNLSIIRKIKLPGEGDGSDEKVR